METLQGLELGDLALRIVLDLADPVPMQPDELSEARLGKLGLQPRAPYTGSELVHGAPPSDAMHVACVH